MKDLTIEQKKIKLIEGKWSFLSTVLTLLNWTFFNISFMSQPYLTWLIAGDVSHCREEPKPNQTLLSRLRVFVYLYVTEMLMFFQGGDLQQSFEVAFLNGNNGFRFRIAGQNYNMTFFPTSKMSQINERYNTTRKVRRRPAKFVSRDDIQELRRYLTNAAVFMLRSAYIKGTQRQVSVDICSMEGSSP